MTGREIHTVDASVWMRWIPAGVIQVTNQPLWCCPDECVTSGFMSRDWWNTKAEKLRRMHGHQRPSQGSYSKAKWEEMETKDSTFLRKGWFTCVLTQTGIKKSQDFSLLPTSSLGCREANKFCSLFYSHNSPVFPTVPKVLLRDCTWYKYPWKVATERPATLCSVLPEC